MSALEIGVILGGLVLGFWLVSFFTAKPTPPPPAKDPNPPHNPRPEVPMPPAWHAVLEVAPNASAEDIRAAYRRCISLYHPDKVATLGAELQALAARKSQDIGAAYRTGMQLHGIDV